MANQHTPTTYNKFTDEQKRSMVTTHLNQTYGEGVEHSFHGDNVLVNNTVYKLKDISAQAIDSYYRQMKDPSELERIKEKQRIRNGEREYVQRATSNRQVKVEKSQAQIMQEQAQSYMKANARNKQAIVTGLPSDRDV